MPVLDAEVEKYGVAEKSPNVVNVNIMVIDACMR